MRNGSAQQYRQRTTSPSRRAVARLPYASPGRPGAGGQAEEAPRQRTPLHDARRGGHDQARPQTLPPLGVVRIQRLRDTQCAYRQARSALRALQQALAATPVGTPEPAPARAAPASAGAAAPGGTTATTGADLALKSIFEALASERGAGWCPATIGGAWARRPFAGPAMPPRGQRRGNAVGDRGYRRGAEQQRGSAPGAGGMRCGRRPPTTRAWTSKPAPESRWRS